VALPARAFCAWAVSRNLHRSAVPTPPRSQSSSPTSVAAAALIRPVSASVYNPLGSPGDDDPGQAQNAIAGNASGPWHTSYYFSPVFGNLKKGTGLILDLGKQVRLSQVVVQFGAQCCTHVQIELGNNSTSTAAALSTFTVLQSSTTAANRTTFTMTKQATGRYLLIWLTDLPPMAGNPGRFETLIYNVVVHGFAAGQPG